MKLLEKESEQIFEQIKMLINDSKNKVYSMVNTEMLNLYWNIGKIIIQIQEGDKRAAYGDRILENGDLFDKENEFFSKVYKRLEDDIIQWYEKLTCNKMEIDGIKPVDENVRLILNKLNEQRD